MSRPTRKLDRDEVRLFNDNIVQIVGGDVWLEFESAVTTDEQNQIINRYQVEDLVTDAVSVQDLEAESQGPMTTLIDYPFQDFCDNAHSGHLVPANLVDTDGDTITINSNHAGSNSEVPPTEEDVIDVLTTAVNSSNVDASAAMEEFDHQHNYLQNEVFESVLKPLIIAVATTPQHDRRNKHARKQAKRIINELDWDIPDER